MDAPPVIRSMTPSLVYRCVKMLRSIQFAPPQIFGHVWRVILKLIVLAFRDVTLVNMANVLDQMFVLAMPDIQTGVAAVFQHVTTLVRTVYARRPTCVPVTKVTSKTMTSAV